MVVGDVIGSTGSHQSLDRLFIAAGAPGAPPDVAHHSKWKEWLFRAGQDPEVDSLAVLGAVLEEFMDVPPRGQEHLGDWKEKRARVEVALAENGLRYYRFGRILPQENPVDDGAPKATVAPTRPQSVDELLEVIVRGLRRAMHPLTHRRKGVQSLAFGNEYDVQDLLHAMLRPWISDIRPEEFTPSYAGSSTRMDLLLPAYGLAIETKIVRDRAHAKRIGDELIIDIDHYRKHPDCRRLWCIVYDPDHLITNADGLKNDLEGDRSAKEGNYNVRLSVIAG